ncbi:hypothetical protein VTK56DRAFT_7124 [Thermocarpiscus australiensis]
MLRLSRQGCSTLKSPGRFICTSCRALLVSGAATLPGAIARLCAARHYSTEKQQKQQKHQKHQTTQPPQNQLPQSPPAAARSRRARRMSSPLSASRVQLWRETLKVLKDIQAGHTSSAPTDPSAVSGSAAPDTPSDAAQSNQSEQTVSASSAPVRTQDSRESKLLEGALVVLKRVLHQELEAEAPQNAKGMLGPERAGKPTPVAPRREEKAAPVKEPKALGPAKQTAVDKPALRVPKYKPSLSTEASKPKPPSIEASKPKPSLAPVQGLKPSTSATGKRRRRLGSFTVERVNASKLVLTPIVKPQPPVPSLSYGLDRVLFNPGVYYLQDPRSRVFNFDPYLACIMPIQEFDFNALKRYVTSSKDTTLINTAAENKKKYTGSTSSMTATLAHFHYLLSAWRPINPAMMSRGFEVDSYNFTRIMRAPAATFLHWKDGTYAIDADKEFDTANILSMLGKSMEKLLTLPKEEFEKYRRSRSDQLSDEERNGPESYHYTSLGDFMMRSQLDAHDPRLPGTGMFDLKTRAVVSIRMDARDFYKGTGYEIRNRFGQWESFEREYYDMIRSAFLKYSLQVRMGRMDGIFVAYHNTQRIFGFQYISLPEMDFSLHGQNDRILGDREFKLSVHLLNKVLDKVTARFPGQSLRLHFETREASTPFMYIFAKPVTPEEVEEVQGASRAAIEEFERRMMGVTRASDRDPEEEDTGEEAGEDGGEEVAEEGDGEEETSLDAWEDVMLKVEDALENEELGLTSVREAIEHALQRSGLLGNKSSDEAQQYVDKFLEALTSNGGPAPEGTTSDPTESQSTTGESQASDAGEVQGISTPNETDREARPPAAGSSTNETTLKDVILRLASQVRAPPSEQRSSPGQADGHTEGDVPPDAVKLRKIEKILSELTAKPREPSDLDKGEEANRVIEEGSLSAEQFERDEQAEQSTEEEPEPAQPSEDSTSEEPAGKASEPGAKEEVYGLILTVRNKVDGHYVKRPEKLRHTQRWVVEYAIEEIAPSRAPRLYKMVLNRRKKLLDPSNNYDDRWFHMFRGKLNEYSQKGRKFRLREDERARQYPVHVYGFDKPYTWESVFEHSKDDGTKQYEEWKPQEVVEKVSEEDSHAESSKEDGSDDATHASESQQGDEPLEHLVPGTDKEKRD